MVSGRTASTSTTPPHTQRPPHHSRPLTELKKCIYTRARALSQDGTVYTGRFNGGRPKGEGKFVFPSGISQQGFYEAVVAEDADEEEPPALLWRGQSVVTC